MSFVYYNPNPEREIVGDCVVRAVAKLTGESWDDVYLGLCTQGFVMKDLPNANHVWGAYLRTRGFVRMPVPNTCPDCYTVAEFCEDNQNGKFLLATGEHAVAVVDGDYYDTWDSGNEVPIYFWTRK